MKRAKAQTAYLQAGAAIRKAWATRATEVAALVKARKEKEELEECKKNNP